MSATIKTIRIISIFTSVLTFICGVILITYATKFGAIWTHYMDTLDYRQKNRPATIGIADALIVMILSIWSILTVVYVRQSCRAFKCYLLSTGVLIAFMVIYGLVVWIESRYPTSRIVVYLDARMRAFSVRQMNNVQSSFHCCGIEKYTDYIMVWHAWRENPLAETSETITYPTVFKIENSTEKPTETTTNETKKKVKRYITSKNVPLWETPQLIAKNYLPINKIKKEKFSPLITDPKINWKHKRHNKTHKKDTIPFKRGKSDEILISALDQILGKALSYLKNRHGDTKTRRADGNETNDDPSDPKINQSNSTGGDNETPENKPEPGIETTTENKTPEQRSGDTTVSPGDNPETPPNEETSEPENKSSDSRDGAEGTKGTDKDREDAPKKQEGNGTKDPYIPEFIWSRWDRTPPSQFVSIPPYSGQLPIGELDKTYWKITNLFFTTSWQSLTEPLNFVCKRLFNDSCPAYERTLPIAIRNWMATLFGFVQIWREWMTNPTKVPLSWWWGSGWDMLFFSQISPNGKPNIPFSCCKNPSTPCYGRVQDTYTDGCKYKLIQYWISSHVQYGYLFMISIVLILINCICVYILYLYCKQHNQSYCNYCG